MQSKRILGILLIVIGGAMVLFSNYIAGQVAQGQAQIDSAQSQVNTTDTLFSGSEYTKPFGKALTGGAQKKIDAGQREVNYYSGLSGKVKVGGIILIVIGAAILFMGRKKR